MLTRVRAEAAGVKPRTATRLHRAMARMRDRLAFMVDDTSLSLRTPWAAQNFQEGAKLRLAFMVVFPPAPDTRQAAPSCGSTAGSSPSANGRARRRGR